VLATRRELLVDGVADDFFRADRFRSFVGVVLYALAGLLGYSVNPAAALVIFLGLPAFYGATAEGYVVFKQRKHRLR
jgi:hypothetical protein